MDTINGRDIEQSISRRDREKEWANSEGQDQTLPEEDEENKSSNFRECNKIDSTQHSKREKATVYQLLSSY